jgi:uncharacterized protein (DUF362 family)
MNTSRRDFIKRVGLAAAGVVVAPYVKPSGLVAYNHKASSSFLATVAITDTTGSPADTYVYDDVGGGVKQKVQYLFDLLDLNQSGAVSGLFGPGKKVAIKINLTGGSGSASNPKLAGYTIAEAMWTHPAVLQAVGQYAIDAGVNPADLYIVEALWDAGWKNPGSTAPFGSNDKFGYRAVQEALGCNVIDLNDTTAANIEAVSTGGSHFNFASFTMNKVLQAVDVYISIPKLKHHSAAGYTGSLKNQVGIVPMPLYMITGETYRRSALHHSSLTAAEWNYLPETVCDLNAARPVHLSVIDGIKNSTGGEGVWCANYQSRSMHALFAGLDPVATDSIGAKIMGLDPAAASLPLPAPLTNGGVTSEITDNHLYLLNGKGAGTNQLSEIQLVGDGVGLVTAVREEPRATQPSEFQLCANFPNPFNPSTMIVFFTPRTERVTLTVYDVTGRAIETLIEGEVPPGEHRLQWSAEGLASGVYLCRMTARGFSQTIKLLYQK